MHEIGKELFVNAIRISHDLRDESIENKARWYQSLTVPKRIDVFCSITNLALTVNPGLVEKKNAQLPQGRFQILSKARSEER